MPRQFHRATKEQTMSSLYREIPLSLAQAILLSIAFWTAVARVIA